MEFFTTSYDALVLGRFLIRRQSHRQPFWRRLSGLIMVNLVLLTAGQLPQPVSSQSQDCVDYCNKHRPLGYREEYKLHCASLNSDAERNNCQKKCDACKSICNGGDFTCARVGVIPKKCMYQCDYSRPRGTLDGHIMLCSKSRATVPGVIDCQKDCSECPNWICDEKVNNDKYYCPTGELSGQCQTNCDSHRNVKFPNGQTDSFQFSCDHFADDQLRKLCEKECSECPKNICNPVRLIGTDIKYYCPEKRSPTPLPPVTTTPGPPTTPTPPQPPPGGSGTPVGPGQNPSPGNGSEVEYGGACQKRCNRHRSAGPNKFTMACTSIYQGNPDLDECLADCRTCPLDICDPVTGTFQCPAVETDLIMIGFIVASIFAVLTSAFAAVGVCAVLIVWRRVKKPGAAGAKNGPPTSSKNQILVKSPPSSMPKITPTSSEPSPSASVAPAPSVSNIPVQKEEESKSPAAARVSGPETASVVTKVKDPRSRSRHRRQTKR